MKLLSDIIQQITSNSTSSDDQASQQVNQVLTEILDDMMFKCESINSAMISSIDGIAWAERLEGGFDKHRFAAMSSALLALGDNLCKEAEAGATQNVIIEGSEGKIFAMHAGSHLVLSVFVDNGSNLGLALSASRQATQKIANLTIN